jgi:hypothetical protein
MLFEAEIQVLHTYVLRGYEADDETDASDIAVNEYPFGRKTEAEVVSVTVKEGTWEQFFS